MQDQAITFNEFEDLYKPQNYKFVRLSNSEGGDIIKFNQPKDAGIDRVKEIGIRLQSKALADGYYIIECKDSLQKSVLPDRYTIIKGDKNKIDEPIPRSISIHHNNKESSVKQYTFEEALQMELQVKRLELEIENLVGANTDLTDQLELMQEDLDRSRDSEEKLMGDNNKGNNQVWIENMLANLTPLADRFFDSQDKRMDLEALKIQQAMGQNQAQAPSPPEEQKTFTYDQLTKEQKAQIDPVALNRLKVEWITSLQYTDPEKFAEIQKNGYHE